jgi:hypothetical protein
MYGRTLLGSYVLLEGLQIQNHGRRGQFAQAARLSYKSRVGSDKTVRNAYFLLCHESILADSVVQDLRQLSWRCRPMV